GEIRFGLGGLKGVGEAAIDSIIEEKTKNGPFVEVFDFIKRVNQRTVNKKTLESLIYAGAFDCFGDMHRARYFQTVAGENITVLEKIIRFGNIYQTQTTQATNTLFGELPSVMEIQTPKIPDCLPWSLTEQLEHEKDVTGIFLSGHPLDHHSFEIKHYGITPISEYLAYKESILTNSNPNRSFRILALVSDAQHRLSRQGKKFGSFTVEDYSGKMEIMLFSEDYL